jgi:chromo domain-containing protein 1
MLAPSPEPEHDEDMIDAPVLENPEAAPVIPVTQQPISSADLNHRIETVCKLNFKEMFSYNGQGNGDIALDRRAFLIYHSQDHMRELELITRWLLMHHVEVFSLWSDGAWEQFWNGTRQGETGVIIV